MSGETMRGACLFGGNWDNGDYAGSRYANVDNWPENSNEWISARGRSDDQFSALQRSRPCRLHTSRPDACGRRSHTEARRSTARTGGQPDHPASANTLHGPAYRGVARAARRQLRRDPRPATFTTSMYSNHERHVAQHHRNLIGRITATTTMREAYRLTSRGKALSPARLEFKEFDALNLGNLSFDMATGAYVQGTPHEFQIFDPKLRTISALPFRDRVAQQALCLVIGPIFDKTLLPRTFACRTGMGTHAGVRALQSDLRRLQRGGDVFFLKTDFSRYFASIDRGVLWELIDAKITCAATRRVLEAMIPREGIGIPIGSLTSQIVANVYGGMLDRFLQQELGERYWYRYMDDLVVLGRGSGHLRAVKEAIERFSRERMGLRFSKWQIAPAARGINFLGYRIWATHKLLRRDSVVRAKRKIAAYRAGGDTERLEKFLGAWIGHAGHADSGNLLQALGLGDRL